MTLLVLPPPAQAKGASVDGLPAFLRASNLNDFISNELVASTTPIEFVPLRGPGYEGRSLCRY